MENDDFNFDAFEFNAMVTEEEQEKSLPPTPKVESVAPKPPPQPERFLVDVKLPEKAIRRIGEALRDLYQETQTMVTKFGPAKQTIKLLAVSLAVKHAAEITTNLTEGKYEEEWEQERIRERLQNAGKKDRGTKTEAGRNRGKDQQRNGRPRLRVRRKDGGD